MVAWTIWAASQQHPTDSQWHSTVPCGVGDQLHVSCDFQHCCPSAGWRSPPPPKVESCCQNGPVHAWDVRTTHAYACMHACPSCLLATFSLLFSLIHSHSHITEEPLPWPTPATLVSLESLSLSWELGHILLGPAHAPLARAKTMQICNACGELA